MYLRADSGLPRAGGTNLFGMMRVYFLLSQPQLSPHTCHHRETSRNLLQGLFHQKLPPAPPSPLHLLYQLNPTHHRCFLGQYARLWCNFLAHRPLLLSQMTPLGLSRSNTTEDNPVGLSFRLHFFCFAFLYCS